MIKLKHAGRKPKQTLAIGIDCGSLSPNSYSGIATITRELLRTLPQLEKKNRYYLYSFFPIEKKLVHGFGSRIYPRNLPRLGFASFWMPLAFMRDKLDVFLALSQTLPRSAPPTIGFVYDVAFLKYPNKYFKVGRIRSNTEQLVYRSRHIITTSQSSKIDLQNVFRVREDFITVAYPGITNVFSPKGIKYIDNLPYFLYVGGLRPIKNIPFLLACFSKFLQTAHQEYRLILIGSREDEDPEIIQTIHRLRLENYIKRLGSVSQIELPKYYRGAIACLTLSLSEGFGIPTIEAMACGTPVIVSKTTALPEVVGKAGIMVEPNDAKSVVKVLVELTQRPDDYQKYVRLGIKQAQKYVWRSFTRKVLDVIYKYGLNS